MGRRLTRRIGADRKRECLVNLEVTPLVFLSNLRARHYSFT
jgi:hypothetical protein